LELREISCSTEGITSHVLGKNEPILSRMLKHLLANINSDSIRFAIYHRRAAHRALDVTPLSVYVMGLPMDDALAAEAVTQALAPLTSKGAKWKLLLTVGKYGVALLQVTGLFEAEKISFLLQSQQLTVRFVCDVLEDLFNSERVKSNMVPVLVCINSKSGGGQGMEVLCKMTKLINPNQVFDITKTGPLQALLMFRNVPEFRVLVCGGDGTVGWVLSALEDVRHLMNCPSPAVGIIPIGTGNDLSRVLGWGPGYEGERIESLLGAVLLAKPEKFDRWTVAFAGPLPVATSVGAKVSSQPDDMIMSNYFGIGLDAYLALGFHEKREAFPEKFTSRLRNKSHYVQLGAQAMKTNPCKTFAKHVTMLCDGKACDIRKYEGIVVLNISSWSGGAAPWGTGKSKQSSESVPFLPFFPLFERSSDLAPLISHCTLACIMVTAPPAHWPASW
jgi:diacylglycerol kinase (ATP)